MIASMTGFARAAHQADWGNLVWEIKSVNHRYLEATFRLPELFRHQEMSFRTALRNKLSRGKCECTLSFLAGGTITNDTHLDETLLNALAHASQRVSQEFPKARELSVADLLRWPGALSISPCIDVSMEQEIAQSFDKALDRLISARQSEGAQLHTLISTRAAELENLRTQALGLCGDVVASARQKLQTRLNDLRASLDEARLEQEVVLLAQRLDVSEELDRLKAHLIELHRLLANDAVLGRRLDFLMQEFNREANTLASKSSDAQLTAIAVEMKVLIEQMREQIQNIE